MVNLNIRKHTNFVSPPSPHIGWCCSEYMATAAFVEVDNLFDSFNGGMCVAR
jgi:hypothetical protein